MPMFYIGHTSIQKIQNGYHGTVVSKMYKEIWNSELQHNPHLFKTIVLTEHDTKPLALAKEEFFHTTYQVHKSSMYINQATANGKFYSDASGKKNPMYGSARFGELNPMYGRKHNDHTRAKMRASGAGKHGGSKSKEHAKAISDALTGRSYEELHGIEKALELRDKLKKPKTKAHKEKQGDTMRNKPKIECPHCGTLAQAGNYVRWHGDNCKSLIKKLTNP